MKKSLIVTLSLLSSLFTSPLPAKLYWESSDTWRSYFPYVTFINKTNHDLYIAATTTSNNETEWLALVKNESISIVINSDFDKLLVSIPNPISPHQVSTYQFTNDVKTDFEEIYEALNTNPHMAIKVRVIIKDVSKPHQQKPKLSVVVEKEIASANRMASYIAAKEIIHPK